MNAPNREHEVAAICGQHPEAFQGPPEDADTRKLALLTTHIIPTLNTMDGGNWGVLTKTDQGNKVPADFMVWHQTMEGFDVLTDHGPMWGPHGVVTNPAWVWTAVGGSSPTPPQPPSGYDMVTAFQSFDPDVRASLGRVERALERLEAGMKAVTERGAAVVVQPPMPLVKFPDYAATAEIVLPAFLGGKRQADVTMKPVEPTR